MNANIPSVLVVGFNTRPLVCSLHESGYIVYAVDFFGDLDLIPCVQDSIVITERLDSEYNFLKENYKDFLVRFTIEMLKKHSDIDYLIIGSGLDDAISERETILNFIRDKNLKTLNLNNDLETIKMARDIQYVYDLLRSSGYQVPKIREFSSFKISDNQFHFPFVLKKKTGAGGVNVYKIESKEKFAFMKKKFEASLLDENNWYIQEYLEGTPVSCTVISDGNNFEIISVNRQIISLNFLNPPKEFMYCGNIVPSYLMEKDMNFISDISLFLVKKLKLKGINGFDFVLKNHYPFLMEINPRIPGSIQVSELALKINLLDLHIKSFEDSKWNSILYNLKNADFKSFATKLIFFAPHLISKKTVKKINSLDYIFDKTVPNPIQKNSPVCTVLYEDNNFADSFFGALKIVDNIKSIVNKKG
ncbi:MAG: ATP-grasp domain-containing protein [Candidatus Lokiarchaeota archaeon]|nr:ATP-grasp domain-containing protein [Candidatus Lokiarchaeota archaeon]